MGFPDQNSTWHHFHNIHQNTVAVIYQTTLWMSSGDCSTNSPENISVELITTAKSPNEFLFPKTLLQD